MAHLRKGKVTDGAKCIFQNLWHERSAGGGVHRAAPDNLDREWGAARIEQRGERAAAGVGAVYGGRDLCYEPGRELRSGV